MICLGGTSMDGKELHNLIIKEVAREQLSRVEYLLKEEIPMTALSKSPEDKKQDALYEAYLFCFDAMTKAHESLKKLIEADDLLSDYKKDQDVGKISMVITQAIQQDLSPVISKFSTLMKAVKKLAIDG